MRAVNDIAWRVVFPRYGERRSQLDEHELVWYQVLAAERDGDHALMKELQERLELLTAALGDSGRDTRFVG